jgi:hypothetical protein
MNSDHFCEKCGDYHAPEIQCVHAFESAVALIMLNVLWSGSLLLSLFAF